MKGGEEEERRRRTEDEGGEAERVKEWETDKGASIPQYIWRAEYDINLLK